MTNKWEDLTFSGNREKVSQLRILAERMLREYNFYSFLSRKKYIGEREKLIHCSVCGHFFKYTQSYESESWWKEGPALDYIDANHEVFLHFWDNHPEILALFTLAE